MNDEKISNETSSDELILGKFKNNEEVIKAYKELESKLGQITAKKDGDQKSTEPKKDDGYEKLQKQIADLQASIEAKKEEANKPLEEKDFRKQVAEGLASLPQDKAAEVQKKIDAGKAQEAELQFIASLADKPKESSAPIEAQEAKGGSDADMFAELNRFYKNNTAWMDKTHPEHLQALEQKKALEKKLGII